MDFAHRLVSLAYQSLGYFVIESVPAGHSEADLLAIKVNEEGEVVERIHVEAQVSVNPVGVLRGQSGLASGRDPRVAAEDYIAKKYASLRLRTAIAGRFQSTDYKCVFVHGRINNKSQLDVFRQHGIDCIPIGQLVRDALKVSPVSELKRQVLTARLINIVEA